MDVLRAAIAIQVMAGTAALFFSKRPRILQQGKVNVYLLYIGFMLVLALAWVSLRTWWGTS